MRMSTRTCHAGCTPAVAGYAAEHPGSESLAEFMPQFRTRAQEDFFQIWDGRGNPSPVRTERRPGPATARRGGRPPDLYELALPDGHRGRAVAESSPCRPGTHGEILTVVMAAEIENLDRARATHSRLAARRGTGVGRGLAADRDLLDQALLQAPPSATLPRSLEARRSRRPAREARRGSPAERVAAGGRELLSGLAEPAARGIGARAALRAQRGPRSWQSARGDAPAGRRRCARSPGRDRVSQRHPRHRCGGHRDGADRGVAAGPDALRGRARVAHSPSRWTCVPRSCGPPA